MERAGLVPGWFNVREARARLADPETQPELLSEGRALSWRWLRETQAQRLHKERLGALQAMGYTVIGSGDGTRGRWDWLYDLVHRRLAAPAADATLPSPTDALRDALSGLGLCPDAVLEGVASVLGLSVAALQDAEPQVLRKTSPEQVSVLLPFLIHHDRAEIRAVAHRWLSCPAVTYQLPPETLMRWLESDTAMASALGPRIETEGPALLGPERLQRLSRTGHGPIRESARRWAARLR